MTYPTAIGCGCLLGAGGASPVHAAQWSLQPILSWLVDHDSSRNMTPQVRGDEQASLSADFMLQRSLENLTLMLQPHFDVRRYSDSTYDPGNDRSVTGAVNWSGERAKFNLNGSIANQNTLGTELTETGIAAPADTRRRSETAAGELDLTQTERRILYTQLSYLGSTYFGSPEVHQQLPGYRYDSASVGERFVLNEHLTVSAGAFGDILHSDRAGGSSHELGGQVEVTYAHSERLNFDVQVGESRRVLSGVSSNGWNALVTATRNFETSSLSFSYLHTLTPYGNGFLVQRQQVTASYKRQFNEYLNADLTVTRIDNNDQTVKLGLDRRYYDNILGGLEWKVSESWVLRTEAGTAWAPPPGSIHTVHEWRTALTLTWKPLQTIISR